MSMLERALKVLPYGASTYSRSHVAFGKDAPLYITHGDGWRSFGVDGHDYLDMVMGLSSVILGHRHPEVDEAVHRQLANGTAMSLAHPLEVEAAERLLAHFPDGHMVYFGTNGSDATTGSIRLARAVTGRTVIIMAKNGYHGFHDWALTGTERGFGIPESDAVWRIASLKDLNLQKYVWPNTAAIIIEPDLHPDWLKPIREWCTAHGALMIADEVMTWQRYPEWTGCAHHGVTPDIWCLGKSLANGMPVSAIVGPRHILQRFAPPAPTAFFSSTWAGHPLSMAAVIATLDVMERENGPQKVWATAQDIYDHVAPLLSSDLPEQFHNDSLHVGPPPFCRITYKSPAVSRHFRKVMAEHGVLVYASHNPSLAHDANAATRLYKAWVAAVDRVASFDDAGPELETSGIMRR